MLSHQAKINEAGRVLIPLALRRQLELNADDDVLLRVENGELIVTPLKVSLQRLQHKVSKHNVHQRTLSNMLQTEENA